MNERREEGFLKVTLLINEIEPCKQCMVHYMKDARIAMPANNHIITLYLGIVLFPYTRRQMNVVKKAPIYVAGTCS